MQPSNARVVLFLGSDLNLEPTALRLELPKFSVTHTEDLVHPLAQLGLPMTGSFSRMTDQNVEISGEDDDGDDDTKNEHKISDILHKTFIEVDEKGTEAAAATAVIMGRMLFIPRVGCNSFWYA